MHRREAPRRAVVQIICLSTTRDTFACCLRFPSLSCSRLQCEVNAESWVLGRLNETPVDRRVYKSEVVFCSHESVVCARHTGVPELVLPDPFPDSSDPFPDFVCG